MVFSLDGVVPDTLLITEVLFCFVLFCFVLFCFVLFCFVLFFFVCLVCFILLLFPLSFLFPLSKNQQTKKVEGKRYSRCIVHVVLAKDSPLIGEKIGEADFPRHFNSAVVAISRQNLPVVVDDLEGLLREKDMKREREGRMEKCFI